MPIYNIADLNIHISPIYKTTKKRLEPYLSDETAYDFDICIHKDEIDEYIRQSDGPCTSVNAESTVILTRICNTVLERFEGFFFHSSSLMLDGEAYVFSAPSGTGKSTHTALWRKYFGGKVTMINDDKPIIRKINDKFYVCGTPWMGKSNIGNNIKAPAKVVYILQRGVENKAVKVNPGDVFKQILQATVVPADKENMSRLLSLLNEFFSSVPLYLLTCNTDIEAVTAAYKAANHRNIKGSY